ncbi:MAG: hypothetical protein A2504_05855 [Bdellovibrionales bacterium RIFOXYD12_FULL_39_22]|nr:MAG: hypothetical protein A2385_05970 [Bdellovibrionales bacterium RIFOXYB1_FULL_39_21]OFZ41826.1 MAG: hypothetical protein A2485_07940 [Bdellovibrionales bacterium RIFOXYC12_FULL_39_17]OFZ50542.1 MAG: hypothetical protein A2404_04890 [Bdellovibrionales bacterium RIFOXYC1_FULL_39_130]OFZ68578.1 MAG: hypothetical protein A2451_16155 [Bdellovibrionales bacterium RIFOXYC2_FULL_39_8]OFZ77765.1 MAG: hypothetical protein A2560_00060 [Bdellovibrionales bacterium RIFOXYD1_FULL_39_84]OFZ93799.1 MAG:
MSKFNSKQLFVVLKQVLKSRKITYRMLCEKSSFSESTLKNMFHANNMSIDRLLEICQLADISFPDLVNLANKEDANDFSFNILQETFFAKNPHYYYFFRECFFEKKDLEQIKKEYKLSDKSVLKYILGLEKLGLLEVHPGNRLRFLVYGKLRWLHNGPWMKRFYPEFMKKIVQLQLENLDNENFRTDFPGFFTLPQRTYEDFGREIQELEIKYREIAFRDSLLSSHEEFVPVTWIFSMIPMDVFALETDIHNI